MPIRYLLAGLLLCLCAALVQAQEGAVTLTLDQAMAWAVEHHPNSLSALDQIDLGQSQKQVARAPLLPSIELKSFQSRQTENLKAMGLNFPAQFGIPNLAGPFNTFDARVRLTQQVFNLEAWQGLSAADHALEVARFQADAIRQQVAASAALVYVERLRMGKALEAAEANLKLAQDLSRLSHDQQKQGLATGVDVTRAETVKNRHSMLLTQAKSNLLDADTRLHRALGMPMNQLIQLMSSLESLPQALPRLQASIDLARGQRPELQALSQLVAQRNSEVDAADAARYPTVGLAGDYGSSAVTPSQYNYHTYSVGVQVSMPLMAGGAIDARRDMARSRKHQAQLQLQDVGDQVEEDVRLSLSSLENSQDQLVTAKSNLELCTLLMTQATDRFSAGLVDNLEVVDAMAQLAMAKSTWIDALAQQKMAQINQQLAVGERLTATISEKH
jgi:outer membrane protein TolC